MHHPLFTTHTIPHSHHHPPTHPPTCLPTRPPSQHPPFRPFLTDCRPPAATIRRRYSCHGWHAMPSAIASLATAGVRLERDSLYSEVLALATSAARRRERGQAPPPSPTRTSKRLRLSSKDALMARIDAARKRQENAHFHLLEMVSSKQRPLTLARLRAVLKDVSDDGTLDLNRVNYINSSTVSGGRCACHDAARCVLHAVRCAPRLASPRRSPPVVAPQLTPSWWPPRPKFLVDVCRSRHVVEGVILKCMKELVLRGADVNKTGSDEGMTALAVCR